MPSAPSNGAVTASGWASSSTSIAGALAATQPEAAAMIQGAAEAYVAESPNFAPLSA